MHTSFRFLASAALAAAFVAAAASPSAAQDAPTAPTAPTADKVALRLSVKPGQKFRFRRVEKGTTTQKTPGGEVPTKVEKQFERTYEVLEVAENGNVRMKVSVGTVTGRLEHPMVGECDFDSSKPAGGMTDQLTAEHTLLGGKSYEVTLSPSGEVLATSGLREHLVGAYAQLAAMGLNVDDFLTEEMVKRTADPREIGVLPDGGVPVGGKWEDTFGQVIPMLGTLNVKSSFTLQSLTGDSATVVTKASGTLDGSGGMVPAELEEFDSNATTRVSREDGLPLGGESSFRTTIRADTPQGEVRVVQTGTHRTERLALEAETGKSDPPAPPGLGSDE